jgi:hypothetical protein
MRVLKILGSALIGCAALFAFTASAQTQNVPVSCNWVQTGSQSGPYTAIITFQCQESTGGVAATRSLTYSSPSWAVTNCSISLASGVLNSGNCQNTSLYRVVPVVVPVSTCPNAGKLITSSCGNSLGSSAFGQWAMQQCGSGCTLRYETVGWTAQCPHPGQSPAGSPEVKVYCK